jgi:hypothetical protein
MRRRRIATFPAWVWLALILLPALLVSCPGGGGGY